jgi:predicted GNAT family acetyltransferase
MEKVIHNEKAHRFYIKSNEKESFLRYEYINDNLINIITTYVPYEQRGKGLASKLAKQALEYAKQKSLKIIPQCSFVRVYLERNKEYQVLVNKPA